MCGIAGYLEKTGDGAAPVGARLLAMLRAVGCRGPDSAGVALYGGAGDGGILRVAFTESGDGDDADSRVVVAAAASRTEVRGTERVGPYLRLEAAALPDGLIAAIEAAAPGVEVVSAGRYLEIVKQIGSPDDLDALFGVSRFVGTHGIGHTRLSTESRIDLSHSQPFWAHGMPDLATVHNGHVTNYHKLRRQYEQRGIHFYTENDSEVIGIYLRDRLLHGCTFAEALDASLYDLDGAFSYLAATENALGYVRDPFGLKPLVVAETAEWVAVATEEIALRNALGNDFTAREPGARRTHVWYRPTAA